MKKNKALCCGEGALHMKLYISADIEGTTGIAHWNETEKNHPDWKWCLFTAY